MIHTSLQNKSVKDALITLHVRYVAAPVNKAKVNMVIICKMFYALALFRELGITSVNQ